MHALPLILGALCVVAIAYRYYSAFIAAKVLALDDARVTPAHAMNDGHNYVPTNKWVLFGHHFAAITGAGPLVGPVLAAQFGFLPGYLWILVGVVLGGAVHDFVILTASMRMNGRSLAEIVRAEIGRGAGLVASIVILFIVTIAIGAMAKVVVTTLAESAWGTFTIGTTIPIAFFMGLYMYRWRRGRIGEASAIGVVLLLLAVYLGRDVADSSIASWFVFSEHQLTVIVAIYGFFASVLPVWLLLCPRDYLSSYMKLGTIGLLIVGIMVVNPELKIPAFSQFLGGGPIVPGSLYPFVFITIACGAISGFHGLIGSGTTPKMIDRESHARMIGYGAMLLEALVGIVALIAAASLDQGDYFAINTTPEKFATLGMHTSELEHMAAAIGERLAGRPGGAVSLAVGMSQIFAGLPGLDTLVSYWYHFAIMFEALFILTTVDSGTRVARFLVQELIGRSSPRFAKTDWIPGTIIATTIVVSAWAYMVWTGSIATLWPLLGISNQMLACMALATATTLLINNGKARYAWVTLTPLLFVGTATEIAAYQLVTRQFFPKGAYLLGTLAVIVMAALLFVVVSAVRKWMQTLQKQPLAVQR
ncbi:MAG: carbon starvation protein A [Deltaproteobacteria bacterium]|nr:carbon starvation protein A [Deltaproteobacteria bacterium]